MSESEWRIKLNEEDRDIVESILRPAEPQEKRGKIVHEGFRFLCLGETGSGKTSLMRVVVYSAVDRGYANFGLIHDTKNIEPEYPQSLQCANVQEWIARGTFRSGDPAFVSFRGDPRRDITVTAEEVAATSLAIARMGQQGPNGEWATNPHVTLIEEASEAATEGRKHIKAPSVLKLLEQGRKMGVSLVATTQSPRKTPLDILGQSSSIAFFRLTGADANYLGDRLDLNGNLIDAIRGPDHEGLPNFKFALYVKGEPWDGEIHQLDKQTALMFE